MSTPNVNLSSLNYVKQWQPLTPYSSGTYVMNPYGQIVQSIASFTSGATYAASNWNSFNGIVYPEAYGAIGDGSTDDGAAFTAAGAAASALAMAAGGTNGSVTVQGKAGKTYRIATSITAASYVRWDMRGCKLLGPITGFAPINSSNNPSVPTATDKASQVAGACFGDLNDQALVYGQKFLGGQYVGFRYGMCSSGFAWAHCQWEDVVFYGCNIGMFAYQGSQNAHFKNTVSNGPSAGVTFVAAATCFATGHPNAGMDNYFCDGMVYENTGHYRDSSVINATFDTWFQAAILRPSTTSSVVAGSRTYNPATPGSALNVSGRAIYVPQRNWRSSFSPIIRNGLFQACGRGAAVIGNPYNGRFEDLSGENMWAAGSDAWLYIVLAGSSTSPSNGVIKNIDTNIYSTNAPTYVVQIVRVVGSEPGAKFTVENVTGPTVRMTNSETDLYRPDIGVGYPGTFSSTAYTLGGTEAGISLESTGSSAATLTIPTNASTPFPVGTTILLFQAGTGQLTISPATGVTLRAKNGTKLSGQYAVAMLRQRVTDQWILSGDTTT